jgi:hypothetical protein
MDDGPDDPARRRVDHELTGDTMGTDSPRIEVVGAGWFFSPTDRRFVNRPRTR